MRFDGRMPGELRPVAIEGNFLACTGGSALIRWGNTQVLCTAMLEEGTMPFLKGSGQGWLTAEYAMLPASTPSRRKRELMKPDGRSMEIRRLIGRSLRSALDMAALGENTIYIDCDVLQADGGTRTASITGAYVALSLGIRRWLSQGRLGRDPLRHQVAAVSMGVLGDTPLVDLCYQEDSSAVVDMNLVMNERGEFIELQGTGEGRAYTQAELSALLALGGSAIEKLMALQREALEDAD